MNQNLSFGEDRWAHDSRPIITETELPENISPEHLEWGLTRGAADIQCLVVAQALLSLPEVSDLAKGGEVVFLPNGHFQPELKAGEAFRRGDFLSVGVVAQGDSSLAMYIDRTGRTVFYPVAITCVKPTVPVVSPTDAFQMHPDYWWNGSTFPRGVSILRREDREVPFCRGPIEVYRYVYSQSGRNRRTSWLLEEFKYAGKPPFEETNQWPGRFFVVIDTSDELGGKMFEKSWYLRAEYDRLYGLEAVSADNNEAGSHMNLYLRLLARQAAHELDSSNPGVYVMRMQKGDPDIRGFGHPNRRR